MNTSGVAEPPEISVASVARLVSVFVGAEVSVTWMFGYFFSNALISTVRVSVAPAPAIGLADQTILPEVADPVADWVGPRPPPPPAPSPAAPAAAGQGERPGYADDGGQLLAAEGASSGIFARSHASSTEDSYFVTLCNSTCVQ